MSEKTIEISYVDYVMLISALSLIKKINSCTSSVSRNYIHTSMIDSDLANQIMLHYDNWIETSEVEEDFDKDLDTLVREIITQSTQILIKSISTIPEEHFNTNHPQFELLKTKEVPLNDAVMHLADIFVKKHLQHLDFIRGRLNEPNKNLTD